MNKYTQTLINDIHDETQRLRDSYSDFTINGQTVESFLEDCNHAQRAKWLIKLHAPISRVLGHSLTDDERHWLFSLVFGRTISTADRITNLETMAWANLVGNPNNTAYAKAMIEDILSERITTRR